MHICMTQAMILKRVNYQNSMIEYRLSTLKLYESSFNQMDFHIKYVG